MNAAPEKVTIPILIFPGTLSTKSFIAVFAASRGTETEHDETISCENSASTLLGKILRVGLDELTLFEFEGVSGEINQICSIVVISFKLIKLTDLAIFGGDSILHKSSMVCCLRIGRGSFGSEGVGVCCSSEEGDCETAVFVHHIGSDIYSRLLVGMGCEWLEFQSQSHCFDFSTGSQQSVSRRNTSYVSQANQQFPLVSIPNNPRQSFRVIMPFMKGVEVRKVKLHHCKKNIVRLDSPESRLPKFMNGVY